MSNILDNHIKIHDNGWVCELVDYEIASASEEEAREIGRLVLKHTCVVIKGQDRAQLTNDKEKEFCSYIGNVQMMPSPKQFDDMDDRKKQLERFRTTFLEEDENGEVVNGIYRVTGKKNKDGNMGLFGHDEVLDWHANQPSSPDRQSCIWLHGIEHTEGSRTSWLNNIMSFEDLTPAFREELQDVTIYCGFTPGRYTISEAFNEHINFDNPLKMVHTNPDGQTGLYFPFYQTFHFEGGKYPGDKKYYKHIAKKLQEHTTQEKFVYNHDWTDGDVVISDQWLSLHKRHHFDGMNKRLLHRIALGYDNIK